LHTVHQLGATKDVLVFMGAWRNLQGVGARLTIFTRLAQINGR
jgi:hypothetical protein